MYSINKCINVYVLLYSTRSLYQIQLIRAARSYFIIIGLYEVKQVPEVSNIRKNTGFAIDVELHVHTITFFLPHSPISVWRETPISIRNERRIIHV